MAQIGTTIRVFIRCIIHKLLVELDVLDEWIPSFQRAIPQELPSL